MSGFSLCISDEKDRTDLLGSTRGLFLIPMRNYPASVLVFKMSGVRCELLL